MPCGRSGRGGSDASGTERGDFGMTVEKQFLQYVFFAYSAVFVLIFLFVTNVWRRTRSLQQQVDAMREDEEPEGES